MIKNTRTLLTNLRRLGFLAVLFALSFPTFGQRPGGGAGGGGFDRSQMNVGRFYGKVVDETGSGVGFATVQLYGMRPDPATGERKETLISGQITEENGDFSLEKLPVMGEFTLKISFLGFADKQQQVSFGLTRENAGGGEGGGRPEGGRPGGMGGGFSAANFDVDLGNIALETSSQTLETIEVTGEINQLTLALDRKSYRVDKNVMATGGTAEDALRNVPSLSIDIDGNLTLRNSSPQLFVDGRPTTLTLDQIPADAIESVEVITNPSAKYDASGGQAGIVNIVMKKERRIGYNGSVRFGVDSYGGTNASADVNAREGKVNAFFGGFYRGRTGTGERETDRQNLFGSPLTNLYQTGDDNSDGYFARARAGIDWFVDNRNTLTFSGSLMRGIRSSNNVLNTRTDSLFSGRTAYSEYIRNSDTEWSFNNIDWAVLYKHLFPKKGKELTADVTYSQSRRDANNSFSTQFLTNSFESNERQGGDGGSKRLVAQLDYVNPLTDKIKMEAGIRASLSDFDNDNLTEIYNSRNDVWLPVDNFADQYAFDDAVFAAYTSVSYQLQKWGFMAGLRAESSQYTGVLPEEGFTFENDFPLSLFPSIFVTHSFSESENLQLSYSRRINRPNFFQLMPFTDFSDSLNLERGNPDLLPEFTNSLEVSYQKIFKGGHNLLISAYYKQATNLITAYQFNEYIPALDQTVIMSSYNNSDNSEAYGVEFTLRNSLWKNAELSSNINLYNSRVDASNVESNLVNERFTWFIKENFSWRLPKDFSFQVSGEYRSRAAFSPSSGRRYHGWGGSTNTAQGYTIERWFVDLGLRKDFFDRKLNLSLSVSDLFRTSYSGSHSESQFFVQDTRRIRNPQEVRLNLSYRFGKMDTSLFKRKNTNDNSGGMDMMN